MAVKRGLIVGGAALAGLLALAGVVFAKPKQPSASPGEPEDMHSPEACEAYKKQRSGINASCNQLQGQIVELDAERIAAYQNGNVELGQQLDAARATLAGQLADCRARVRELDDLIEGCA